MRSDGRRAARTTIAAFAIAVVASACSIPTDEEARAVEGGTEALLTTTTLVEETVPPDEEPEHTMPLYYFNDENGLVRVDRGRDEVPTVQEILDALAASPTDDELAQYPGIATSFLPDLEATAAGDLSESGVLTVMVAGQALREAVDTNPPRVREVYTQIVCSMEAFTTLIDAVLITDEEGAIRVQGQDGQVIEGPVSQAEVNECKTAEELAAEAAAEAEASGEGEATTTTTS